MGVTRESSVPRNSKIVKLAEFETHLGQTPSDSTGLLSTEVKRELLALVELAEVGAGLLVDDGEASSNRLADNGAVQRR
jgi:hypothetical protein